MAPAAVELQATDYPLVTIVGSDRSKETPQPIRDGLARFVTATRVDDLDGALARVTAAALRLWRELAEQGDARAQLRYEDQQSMRAVPPSGAVGQSAQSQFPWLQRHGSERSHTVR